MKLVTILAHFCEGTVPLFDPTREVGPCVIGDNDILHPYGAS